MVKQDKNVDMDFLKFRFRTRKKNNFNEILAFQNWRYETTLDKNLYLGFLQIYRTIAMDKFYFFLRY